MGEGLYKYAHKSIQSYEIIRFIVWKVIIRYVELIHSTAKHQKFPIFSRIECNDVSFVGFPGGFAFVFIAQDVQSGQDFALKVKYSPFR